MYNSIIGTSFTSSYLQFTNNFYAEWQVDKNWKATARIGVSENEMIWMISIPPHIPFCKC